MNALGMKIALEMLHLSESWELSGRCLACFGHNNVYTQTFQDDSYLTPASLAEQRG